MPGIERFAPKPNEVRLTELILEEISKTQADIVQELGAAGLALLPTDAALNNGGLDRLTLLQELMGDNPPTARIHSVIDFVAGCNAYDASDTHGIPQW